MAFEGVGEVQFCVGVYPADCAIGPIAPVPARPLRALTAAPELR